MNKSIQPKSVTQVVADFVKKIDVTEILIIAAIVLIMASIIIPILQRAGGGERLDVSCSDGRSYQNVRGSVNERSGAVEIYDKNEHFTLTGNCTVKHLK